MSTTDTATMATLASAMIMAMMSAATGSRRARPRGYSSLFTVPIARSASLDDYDFVSICLFIYTHHMIMTLATSTQLSITVDMIAKESLSTTATILLARIRMFAPRMIIDNNLSLLF